MKIIQMLCLTAAVAMPALAADVQKLDQRVESAQMVLHELMDTPDHGIPDGVASHATCVAVIRATKKERSSSAHSTVKASSPVAPAMAGAHPPSSS